MEVKKALSSPNLGFKFGAGDMIFSILLFGYLCIPSLLMVSLGSSSPGLLESILYFLGAVIAIPANILFHSFVLPKAYEIVKRKVRGLERCK